MHKFREHESLHLYRSRSKSFRLVHHHISANDCDIRQKLVICKRILDSTFSSVITANGVTSEPVPEEVGTAITLPFRPFSGKYRLFSYVHKLYCHIHKIGLRVFIHNPHNFACVHSRATSDSNYAVRSKCSHSLCNLCC